MLRVDYLKELWPRTNATQPASEVASALVRAAHADAPGVQFLDNAMLRGCKSEPLTVIIDSTRLHEDPTLSCDFPYRPKSTALLIIDMQRYFTKPDSTFARLSAMRIPGGGIERYFERLDTLVIPNLRGLQRAFRKNECPVIYTLLGSNRSDGSDLPAWARRLNEAGRAAFGSPVLPKFDDPSAQLDERIVSQPDELILHKTTIGAMASSSLDVDLRTRGITAVVVTGVLSAYCVTQTARELADRDFDVGLVEDACASLTEAAHAAALGAFAAVYGWVLSTEEMIAAIHESRAV